MWRGVALRHSACRRATALRCLRRGGYGTATAPRMSMMMCPSMPAIDSIPSVACDSDGASATREVRGGDRVSSAWGLDSQRGALR